MKPRQLQIFNPHIQAFKIKLWVIKAQNFFGLVAE